MNPAPLPASTWTTGTTEVLRTGTWRAALPSYERRLSPCRLACPVDGQIADWIGLARAGDTLAAWRALVENNPFPAVAGRVCHHPCESACNRGGFDEPVAVRALERHVGDVALAEGWEFAPAPLGKGRVAVVGGGPSGLSAAYQLRRRGYAVSLYETQRALGGLLRDGIPSYRLPREVLDGEIQRIVALGLDLRLGESLERGGLERLREQYDAVVLAIGARLQKQLPLLDYRQPWVMDGAAWLAAANAGEPPGLGRRMVVIGGGSAAMDVARSARRAGHAVCVLALESEAQMPAQREEVEQAKAEGVALWPGGQLVSVSANAESQRELRLACRRVHLRSVQPFRVEPSTGGEFTLAADAIVPAIGQDPDLSLFGSLLDPDGALLRIDEGGATSLKGVFAGGDVASRARFVTHAVGMGRQAALEIDSWLQDRTALRPRREAPVALEAINTAYHARAARTADALAEAARCFSCGRCTSCDNCFQYCPDLSVRRTTGGYAIALEYCKGCGLCVRECPTGAIRMTEEAR